MTGLQCLVLALLVVLCSIILQVWSKFVMFVGQYWWKPRLMRRLLMKQGLAGPRPSFMVGNMHEIAKIKTEVAATDMEVGDHDIMVRVCGYYCQWAEKYGKRLVFWWGIEPRITVTEPEIIREILATKAGHFGKSPLQQKGGTALLGNGLIMANGEDWAHRRRIVSRAFQLEKLKGMVPSMVQSTNQILEQWDALIRMNGGQTAEIDVYEQFAIVTADVIARTSFGSSYDQGKKVFDLLRSLQKIFAQSNRFVWLPGSRFLPTPTNRKVSALKKAIAKSLNEIVDVRRRSIGTGVDASYGNDLLGLMLAESAGTTSKSSTKSFKFSTEELVEECKTFFFVGHETTLILLTWTMMLLALYPEWQDKARLEVQENFKGGEPDADMLSKLKTVNMVLNESLRLYPPAPVLVRESFKDMKLGDMFVPKGCTFWMPILAIHHDSELWGPDSKEFRPERFAEGISKACKRPNEFMPFSFGPRACVGQTFAMMEAKTILAMVLLRYRFRLSSSYRHAPVTSITIKPKYGMPLIVEHV
ncbi:hypothetical protein O6H91_07G007100 [Diphasiastrum complanatum]|uniref:Uncharacterized protein n=1 Tax=Diphasiastrum complanatum TaxID=34168 RepID=A0ACC2D2C7_DIPCM|nr:hypothetical protein O6H91_07G007100 [Diphasiastrum complanatum]